MEEDINIIFEKLLNYFSNEVGIESIDADNYSSLSLALIGDAVYDLFIRYYVMGFGDDKVNNLHGKKSYFVKAKTQAEFINSYVDQLNEKELNIYKRARNKKSNTVAKNAKVIEYRKATGFEALLGYLFLNSDYKRLIEIIKKSIEYSKR